MDNGKVKSREVVCRYCHERFSSASKELDPVKCPVCNKQFYFVNNVSIDIDDFDDLDDYPVKSTSAVANKFLLKTLIVSSGVSILVSCLITLSVVMVLVRGTGAQNDYDLEEFNNTLSSIHNYQHRTEQRFNAIDADLSGVRDNVQLINRDIDTLKTDFLSHNMILLQMDRFLKGQSEQEQIQKVVESFISVEEVEKGETEHVVVQSELGNRHSQLREVSNASYPSVSGLASGSEQAQNRQRAAVQATGLPLEVECKKTGMRFRLIPAGGFVMGSSLSPSQVNSQYPGGHVSWYEREHPQRTVRITHPFYIGVYEVTQAQYHHVMGSNPSNWKGGNLPVERVSWNDATEFCRRMSQLTGLTIALPTEAQWEYACRAGTTTPYYFGGNPNQLGEYAWFSSNSGNKTHPVGTKKPNAFGLYDMHGNVWEWCADWFQDSYNGLANTDPQGPQSGASRVLRGGSWYDDAHYCRSAYRTRRAPVSPNHNLGFRVVVFSVGLDF